MTTIFTDDFAYTGLDVSLDEPELGRKGRQLILTTDDNREFRVYLNDEQLQDLADTLKLEGYHADDLEEEI